MDKKYIFSIDIAGAPFTVELGRMAEQATASVLASWGGTVVLTTVVISNAEKNLDYFPLQVQYEERHYAAGKVMGSRFVRRESRPTEEAVLSARLIDRTIRPLFNHTLRREVQVVPTVLSIDNEHDPEFVGLLGASIALAISPIPWGGPVAGAKTVLRAGSSDILINTGESGIDREKKTIFSGFFAGTADQINMIEFEGVEAKEDDVVRAAELALAEIKRLVEFQNEIVKKVGVKKFEISESEERLSVRELIKSFAESRLKKAMYGGDKMEREVKIAELKKLLEDHLKEKGVSDKERAWALLGLDDEIDALVHKEILETDNRPDGRALDEVRQLKTEVKLFERLHGSALFSRGNTQSFASVTLAPPGQELTIESIGFSGNKHFLLHYNFPSYSVGETGPFRGPGRREIGHGNLAAKAIRNMIPEFDSFPYTIRVVSEILSSNGSSSQASICAATLALMDAGVPIKKPVAGIAMGLIVESTAQNAKSKSQNLKYKILTDIQGPEDHYGDMDFKVAGTDAGVNAIQMDVKISGVTPEVIGAVLIQAKKARLHILETMLKTIASPRLDLSPFAPIIQMTRIPVDKIGELIGPGGKNINGLIASTGVIAIDIEEDGRVFVSGNTKEQVDKAMVSVKAIGKEYKIGEIVEGSIIKILDFGAIVDLGGGKDGMIHVSELKAGFVKKVDDVVHLGDFVRAKVIRAEDGKIGLTLKGMAGSD